MCNIHVYVSMLSNIELCSYSDPTPDDDAYLHTSFVKEPTIQHTKLQELEHDNEELKNSLQKSEEQK